MSKRSKYTSEWKLRILQKYGEGKLSQVEICSKYGIHHSTLQEWRYNFEVYGSEGLVASNQQKEYPPELRDQAVRECLEGLDSIRNTAHKYGVSDHRVLRRWIKRYNGHSEMGISRKGLSQAMTKGKSTTWQERIKITEYCIAHNKDYQKTIDAYNVSYQQIYSWVRKYEDGGINALKDGRGRIKAESELTPEELQKLAMKKLEAENKKLLGEIRNIYEEVGGIYGYRRILLTLNRRLGRRLNHKRIYRLMRLMGLKSVIRIKRKSYVKATPQHIAENLLNRDFTAEGPNEKWLTDVTESNMAMAKKPKHM